MIDTIILDIGNVLAHFRWKEYLHEFEFEENVDGSVISYQVKCIKPQKRIYEELINKYAIVPEKAVFFDDKQENIDTAIKCGIKGIVFTSLEQAKTALDEIITSAV